MRRWRTLQQRSSSMQPAENAPTIPRAVWIRALRWLLPLALLVFTFVLAGRELTTFDLRSLQRTLIAMPTPGAIGVAVFALASVAYTGLIDLAIARWLKFPIGTLPLLRLSFVANSLANTLNLSGAVGSGVRLLGLKGHGVSLRSGAALVGLQILSLPLGLSVLIIGALASGHLPAMPSHASRVLALIVLGASALYLPVYFVLTGRRGLMGWLPEDQGVPPLGLRAKLAALSLIDWVLAAATLWLCLALAGAHIGPFALLAAFGAAATLGLVSMIPGGLGVFDGLLLLALTSAGIPVGTAAAGLFLFRVVYYLLPMLLALWLGAGMLAQRMPALTRLRERMTAHPLIELLVVPAGYLANFGIRMLALLTFGAGVLLLIAAALPSLHQRIVHAGLDTMPVVLEGSHWLSVVIGVLLLGLARGIDGRLRLAYRAVQWLLWLAAILVLLKGLHWGQALFLLAVSLLLRIRRADFSRRAVRMASGVNLGWLLGLLFVVAVFFAVGLAEIFQVDSFDLLATGPHAHASRLGRGLGAALLGLSLYLVWQAFAVRKPKLPLPDAGEIDRMQALYAKHGGGAFAHLGFMGDKHLFWGDGHRTLVTYGLIRDRLIALGAPSGDPAAQARCILDFRRYADSLGCVPVFYEVLELDLARFHDLGFDLFKLGELALIPLADFSMTGKRWEDLRQAINRAPREKLRCEIVNAPYDSTLLASLQAVSDAWLADKGAAEKGFSLGRFDPTYLARGPLVLVRQEDELVAFASLMPGYGAKGIAGIDLMRHIPDAPRGTMDLVFAYALQWAKSHDYAAFSLGMAPLSNVGTTPYARINERLAALAFRHGNRFYNYQGVRRYKEKFRPEWVGAYLAYPRGLWVPALLTDIAALVAGGYRRLVLPS